MKQKETKNDERFEDTCKNYSPEQWEQYLKTLETPQREQTLEDASFSELYSTENHEELFGKSEAMEEETREKTEAIKDILKYLSPQKRECIRLFFWEGMCNREIAKSLDVSKRTVIRLKKRALKELEELHKKEKEILENEIKSA